MWIIISRRNKTDKIIHSSTSEIITFYYYFVSSAGKSGLKLHYRLTENTQNVFPLQRVFILLYLILNYYLFNSPPNNESPTRNR